MECELRINLSKKKKNFYFVQKEIIKIHINTVPLPLIIQAWSIKLKHVQKMQDKNTNMVKKKLCTSSFSKHGLPTPQVHISPSSYCHPEAVNSITIKMASAILTQKVLLPSVVR